METGPEPRSALEAAFREEFARDRLTSHVRVAAFIGFVINTAFAFLDAIAYPEHLELFLGLRAGLNATFALLYFRTSRTHPRLSQFVFSLSLGAAMLAMIYKTGGPTSDYFVGLILVMVGIGVLLPLSALESIAICTAIVTPYALSPLFVEAPFDAHNFGIRLVFVASGALECIASCVFLQSLRFKDFLQRRALEQARDHLREMDRLKSRFTANVHHELRTPLSLMLAPLETMLSGGFGEIPPAIRDYLQTMQANGLRLLKLINNLLDLAKLENRQLRLRKRPLQLAARIEAVVAEARPMAERKQIVLTSRIDAGLPAVRADADAIDKILVNLLGNALKFTPRHGRIRFTAYADAEQLHVIVKDTGIGIPSNELERIFDRFAQVDASATRRFEGTGIGLSLCQELVELHGGRIWAESGGSGNGSRFHFTLPRGEADAEVPDGALEGARASSKLQEAVDGLGAELNLDTDEGEEAAEAPRAAGAPDRPVVVLAEDNADMRKLLTHLLSAEFRVHPTRDGRQALEAVRAERPALVVTDVMMPEMSGTELCQALKSDVATRAIPVMLVTSKAERELKIEGLERGADDYVTKPFHPRELLARARALVRLRLLQVELADRNIDLERALEELTRTQAQLVHQGKMASLGRFVAGVAHEMNNPLNFVQGNLYHLRRYAQTLGAALERYQEVVELLARTSGKPPEVREEFDLEFVASDLGSVLDACEEGVERATTLVKDLLTFSHHGGSERAATDLHKGIESTLTLLSDRLRGVRVVREYGELPTVECIASQMNQVFMNLLANAADALDGSGTITIRTTCLPGDRVGVEVRDDGPGIPPETLCRVFDPFFTTKEVGEGTGLGLSISYGVVARHGGDLRVESEPGEGTRFLLELPVRLAAADPDPAREDEARGAGDAR